jgi:C-terminal processing protease CtpA/Prc
MSALAPKTSSLSSVDEPIQTDGCCPSAIDLAPEGVTPEPRPTSVLLQQDAKGHLAATARLAFSHNPVRDTLAQELDRGIRKLAERRYEIKRRTLELALGNLGLVARSVHVMPDARDGKPFGFRLFAIKADGPVAKLGLRNDDVLVSINGLDIATPDHVLDAYSKLKTASHLVLELVRERHEMIQEYTIR